MQVGQAQHSPPSNQELFEMFLREAHIRGLTKRTIEDYESRLKYFFNFIKKHAIEMTINDFKDFLVNIKDERGLSDSSINNYFAALHSFYEFLTFEGYLKVNPIVMFRKRYLAYLRLNRFKKMNSERQLISIEDMKNLILSILDLRDKAVVTLLAKTGIRRQELINIDVDDIDWKEQSITLKPTRKRTNRVVFFDDECGRILKRWVDLRKNRAPDGERALFINERGTRLDRHGVYDIVTKHAERVGLHNPDSKNPREKFTPHCCRHWFTTHLRRAGMPREYIKELRGDARNEPIDIYDHIDREELRESYLAHIPQLGI
jgi:integrase/recombinase XerD